MASVATFGLSKIEIKKTEETEDQYKTLGMTYQDSCMLTQNEPEVIDHYAEESDVPVVSVSKGGKVLLTFSIMDADVDALVELMGGTKDLESGAWNAPCQSDGGIEHSGNAQVGLADRDPPRFGGGQAQRQFFPFGAFPDHGYGDGVQGGGQAADHRPSETGRCVKGARMPGQASPFRGTSVLRKGLDALQGTFVGDAVGQRTAQGGVVRVLQLFAYRYSAGDGGDAQVLAGEHLVDIVSGGVAFDGG